ncbi:MAG: glutathione S-transferase family protein [Alphaproteobacteria bacterium]|nr:glutathione S-transferase family protein [Alphaproteobacteria bacterium]
MSEVILHGVGPSSYVRTCRMALDEKGVAYTLDPAMPQSPEQLARHPWGKIPSMTHGDVRLYESLAITRYVDEAFEGPALQPADAAGRARMDQWISAFIDYMYAPIVRSIVIQRVVVETPDSDIIAAAVPDAAKCIGLLNEQLGATPYLAGADLSLADLFVLPAINYVAMVPEGGPLLAEAGNVTAWAERMEARDAAQIALAA